MCCMYTVYSGMQEWVIQIPSIPILVSVLFPSLHLKYFRIKYLLLVNNMVTMDDLPLLQIITSLGEFFTLACTEVIQRHFLSAEVTF